MKAAFKNSLPAICCYFPLGIVYGVLFTQQGYSWFWAPLFSTFVYAGAMQFLGLTIMVAGGSLLTLALALIPLGIRNIFYGMTLFDRFKSCHPLVRAYLAHGLVDATYSILISGPRLENEKKDISYITLLTVIIHLSWILGTLLGTFAHIFFELPKGLEFSLTAFFAALAVEKVRKKKEFMPILIALISIPIALYLAPGQMFLTGMGITVLAIVVIPKKERMPA